MAAPVTPGNAVAFEGRHTRIKAWPWLFAAVIASAASAQEATGFPAGSSLAAARDLDAHLSGKTFNAIYADGTRVQTRFDADQGLFASAPGYTDSGKWRTEDGKLCGSLRRSGEFCNEARLDAGTLYLRRMNGEVVRYTPK